ncbi:hypothetical protein OCGS_1358 [Oceaniovalibus guishaninsula JLT2003]|uniref:Uncharacterized protein n=1 Tax=Oceaniovalibus guishaninsula JLT2003 TaxID=1231392 RepID=K2I6A7_9RHOB|nr:hypothetical protein [Oceaniovalibus guishaninsula]EKE44520.1 hypothetical protein OCGS_1358 [Oceaniovalibus guishaninsula JLT2003]
MLRTLYLHIGAHRTATSSTQRFLHNNAPALLKQGYLYPFGVRRHMDLMNEVFAGKRSAAQVAGALNDAARGQDVHTAILSDEDVAMRRDLSPLAALRRHFDVRVVYAMRRQDTWLESWYLQNIKWQWNDSLAHVTFPEFLARSEEFHWIHYDRFLAHVAGLFGAENIVPLVFEKGQMPDGPVLAFCRAVGLRDMSEARKVPHVNSSRSPQMAEFMRLLPLDRAATDVRNALASACETVDRRSLGHKGKQSELLMEPGLRRAVMARYADGNAAVARHYLDRDALFLDPLPPEDAPLASLTLPADPEVLMARFVAPLFEALIEKGAVVNPRKAGAAKDRG